VGDQLLLPAGQISLPGCGNSNSSEHPFSKPGEDVLKEPGNLNYTESPTLPLQYLQPLFHAVVCTLHTFPKAADSMKRLLSNKPDSFPFLNILLTELFKTTLAVGCHMQAALAAMLL
jgi:hypothetical protein